MITIKTIIIIRIDSGSSNATRDTITTIVKCYNSWFLSSFDQNSSCSYEL